MKQGSALGPLRPSVSDVTRRRRRRIVIQPLRYLYACLLNFDDQPSRSSLPTGVIPPGVMPPGVMPPGMLPPGLMPPVPTGVMPPGVSVPLTPEKSKREKRVSFFFGGGGKSSQRGSNRVVCVCDGSQYLFFVLGEGAREQGGRRAGGRMS